MFAVLAALLLLALGGCAALPSGGSGTPSPAPAKADEPVSRRDASGEYDPAEAEVLSPGDSLTVTGAGVYVLSDVYEGGPLVVSAGPEDKVQLVLAGAVLSKGSGPAIEVCSADKVFVTAAVSSEADLTVNGGGKLTVRAGEGHAVFSRDDLVVTAKNLSVEAGDIGLNGRDSVRLSEENVCITAGSDGIHSNGSVRITGGTLTVTVKSEEADGVDSNGDIRISGGTVDVSARSAFDGDGSAVLAGGTVYVNGEQVTELPRRSD